MAGIGTVNFNGLASGLDTDQLISQMMEIESQSLKKMEARKQEITGKQDTYTSMKTDLLEMKNIISKLRSSSGFGEFSASSSDEEALTVSASTSANAGTYTVKVLSLAQAEVLSGDSYEDTGADLGLSGQIIVNDAAATIQAGDSLIDIRNNINRLDAGVSASILKISATDNRLVLTAGEGGAGGFRVANAGPSDILGALGLSDGTVHVREVADSTVYSDGFDSSQSTIGSLLDIDGAVSGEIAIRNRKVAIDLGSDSLSSISDKINELNIDGVSASVERINDDNQTGYRLAVTGTMDFGDDNNILQVLGILENGTSGIAETYQAGTVFEAPGNSLLNSMLTDYGAVAGDTYTISGTDHDGNAVSAALEIDKNTKMSDVLDAIENTFNNTVTATLENGKITVTDTTAGESEFSFRITANNESGGTLDFGISSRALAGRERLVVDGTDAVVRINNIKITRSNNEINDAIAGVTMTLKEASENTTHTITVERDVDAVKENITEFVNSFNEYVDYINEQSAYDEEEETAGPLNGDLTSRTILSRIKNALQNSVESGNDSRYSQLIQLGIESTTEGKLQVDDGKLEEALTENIDSVIALFTATKTASDNDISVVYATDKTRSGTYDVEITRAAGKATATSVAIGEEIPEDGTLAVEDHTGNALTVAYTAGSSIRDIADSINEEAAQSYALQIRSDNGLTTNAGAAATQQTAIADLDGVTMGENETITLSGTYRNGNAYKRTMQVDASTTVGDVISFIEQMNNNELNATLDTAGRLRIEDKTSRKSSFGIAIDSTIDGLTFGTFETLQAGRTAVNVSASVNDDNTLSIRHANYGSGSTFSISGGAPLGITDGGYAGVDVTGTINGVSGTGSGQTLKASNDDENSQGLILNVNLTAEELAREGTSQGTVTFNAGIAEMLYGELTSMTDSVNGFVQAKIDSLDISLDTMDDRIAQMNKRLELRQNQYVRRFTEMELAMARLQSLQQQLQASLGSLPKVSLSQ